MTPEVSIIAAVAKGNRVIGREGVLPWRISPDLKRFKELTSGNAVLMGRKTFESIGRSLPNRTNIVITRNENYKTPGCVVVHSLEEALEAAKQSGHEKVFIIGGGQIYEQAMKVADRLVLTEVEGEFEGDAFFPDYSGFGRVVSREACEHEGYRFEFVEMERQ